MKGIDLFAGAGGTTTGAKKAGVEIVWAANHNPLAVAYHAMNHPDTQHETQDLQQADWSLVPEHDIVFASPCCQGHSRASGSRKNSKKADTSRSTAWAVVSCLEAHRTPIAVIENVTDFLNWVLFKPWESAMNALGYSLSINIVNASDLGVPQNRERVIIIATRSANPIKLNLPKVQHVPARSFIDLNVTGYKWDSVDKRVPATQFRVKNGQKQFGDIFLDAAYGSARTGRSIDKPIGAIMTVNKHSLVIENKIRPLSLSELAAAQTFDSDYIWPASAVATKSMIGNAVPPLMAQRYIEAVLKACY